MYLVNNETCCWYSLCGDLRLLTFPGVSGTRSRGSGPRAAAGIGAWCSCECAHARLFSTRPVVTSAFGGAGGEGEEAVWKLCGVVLEKKPLK